MSIMIGCGRGANLRDEQMSIAYRRDRINLISMKPRGCLRHQMPGRDMKNRVAVLAQQQRRFLKILRTIRYFGFINTHLDHIGTGQERKG